MPRVRLLSKNLVNQIAAGEVLERPSSAVKELVENSLDANSEKIDIFVRNGGKTEIKILDNGHGMTKEDLKMSIMRHATSKFNNENFSEIKTHGFRGEALPAIGAVAKMNIISKTEKSDNGFEINVNSGNISNIKPIARERGTTVTIKDIFFSTPARLKFLKSEKHENYLIKKLIQKLAICNFNTRFQLQINQKMIMITKKNNSQDQMENLKSRIVDCLGLEFLENMREFSSIENGLEIFGCLGIPTFNHSNNTNQFVYVNGRVVNDKILNSAIKYAYGDFIAYHRHSQLIIFINIPGEDVDINVHPTKSEVKFRDSNNLRRLLIKSIRNSLKEIGYNSSTQNTRKIIEKFKPTHNFKLNIERNFFDYSVKNEKLDFFSKEDINDKIKSDHSKFEGYFPMGFAKCQLYKTYIISQTEEGFIIVDQHAAHERIVYEKIKKKFYDKCIRTQILLIPEIIKVDSLMIDILEKYDDRLRTFGIILEKFGEDSVLIREIPVILKECNIKELTLDILTEISENDKNELLEFEINKICSVMACHGSIRAGREMKTEEMNHLLREMESTPYSGQCNHGRPTFIKLDFHDIEKLFGRK